MTQALIEVRNLKQYYHQDHTVVKAVDDVSFTVQAGETFGLVGESGSGKSTIGRAIVNLYQPTDGQILYQGKALSDLSKGERLDYNKDVQMIFQDPYASLNPRMKVQDIVAEGMEVHGLVASKPKWRSSWLQSVCHLNMPCAIRMNFRAANANGLGLRVPWRLNLSLLSAMNLSQPWMSPSKPKSLTYCKACKKSEA